MYQITSDPVRHRVELVMVGAFSAPERLSAPGIAAFQTEVKAAALRAKSRAGAFDMLVDLTASSVLPKDVATDSQEFLAWLVANGLRRSANITNSALLKMQVKRVSADDRFQMFGTREAAIAWLDAF